MSRTFNFLKTVAFAVVTILVFINTATTIRAEETEPEKKLGLYNYDGDIDGDGIEDLWVGFTSEIDERDTSLEITYAGKTLTCLQEEGYIVEYRTFDESNDYMLSTNFNSIDNLEIYKDIIYLYPGDRNIFQFRITDINGNIISMSDRLVCDLESSNFPVIISSNPYHYDEHNFNGKSVKIILKYNENLLTTEESDAVMKIYNYKDIEGCFTTNLEIDNHIENVVINNYEYVIKYCYVSFYCTFTHVKPKYENDYINYYFQLENTIGSTSYNSPINFIYTINIYEEKPVKKIIIKNHENRLKLDEKLKLSTNISEDGLIWVSSDENIATVDETGLVTATGLGKAYIYITKPNDAELYDYSIINVKKDIPVKKVSLDVSTLEMKKGTKYKFVSTVSPSNAFDTSLKWTSSDKTLATVDSNGVVTAKKTGTVIITATSNYDPTIKTTCHIIITEPIYKVKTVNITGIPKTIKYNSSFQLKATIAPSNATNKKLKWTSSNTKYATVNSKGFVTIKTTGAGKTVKITATATDGSNAKKTVTLKISKIPVKKITLKAPTTIVAGKSAKITATISPSNATTKVLKWSCNNTKYATVTSSGLVKTKKYGKGKTVKITATATDGSKIKISKTIKIK